MSLPPSNHPGSHKNSSASPSTITARGGSATPIKIGRSAARWVRVGAGQRLGAFCADDDEHWSPFRPTVSDPAGCASFGPTADWGRAGKNGFGDSDQIFIDEKWLLFEKGLTSIERYSPLVSVYASSTSIFFFFKLIAH